MPKEPSGLPAPTLTIEEVAEFLRMPIDRVRKLASAGKIPGAGKVGGQWRFRREPLLALFEQGSAPDADDDAAATEPDS